MLKYCVVDPREFEEPASCFWYATCQDRRRQVGFASEESGRYDN